MNLSSRGEVSAYLREKGLAPKKRWGQNFLVDGNYRRRIVDAVGARPEDTAWEIGPGLGSLTEFLVDEVSRLVLFELDWGLIRHLREVFGASASIRLVEGDFRKTWSSTLGEMGPPSVVVGNLPYRLAATMIGDLLQAALQCRTMVYTVQQEVAARMIADAGSSDYSGFSVLCQIGAEVSVLFDVSPSAFLPVPEVRSSVVRLVPRANVNSTLMATVSRVVRGCFASRRKTLRRNIAAFDHSGDLARAFESFGIDLGLRAEQVSPHTFYSVCDRLIDWGPAEVR